MIGFVLMKWVTNKPHDTGGALYVSVSGGFSVPCMVIDLIMSQITKAMSFYKGYFGHMTKFTAFPMWVCFGWWLTKHFQWSTEHFTPTSG